MIKYFALCGQSNMAGYAPVPLLQSVSHRVQMWTGNAWVLAAEPIHGTYAGPGMGFALGLLALLPDAEIRLIPCAVSGTSIAQWQRGQAVYNDAISKVNSVRGSEYLSGVLFAQGEADTFSLASAEAWAGLALTFARDFRTDTGKLEVPFLYAQLGADPGDPARVGWVPLRDTHQPTIHNPSVYPYIRMVRTMDLPVVAQHFLDAETYAVVGRRFASKYFEGWG